MLYSRSRRHRSRATATTAPQQRRWGFAQVLAAAKIRAVMSAQATRPVQIKTGFALIDKYGVEELTFNDYFRLTRAGKVTVINKRKLYRDHLELSTLFRGWPCSFCNVNKIPLLDARTTAEYKLYQGRLYVNCTTFPSS